MKKRMPLLMLILGGLMLTSCGGAPSNEPEQDKDGNTIVKLMVHVDSKTAEGMAYKKRVDAFNKEYKDKKIQASIIYQPRTGGAADYETKLFSLKASNKIPDIIAFDAPKVAFYAKNNLITDMTSYISQDIKDDFLSLNTYDGKLYGLPIQESSAGFFYNKNIFRAANIDVSMYTVENPWTFAEFKDVCRRLKGHGVKTVVDMRLDATKDETAPYLLYPFIYAANGEFVSPDGWTATGYFNKQETKNGFQFLRDLVDADYTNYNINAQDFFTGEAAMYLSSGWTITDLDNKYPEVFPNRDSWGLLPYPKDINAASATGSWSYALGNNSVEDKSATVELLKWMSSAESANVITAATGMIPARKSCNPNFAVGSPEYTLLKQLELTGRERAVTVGYPQLSNSINAVINKIGVLSNNVSDVVENETKNLQAELDRAKR